MICRYGSHFCFHSPSGDRCRERHRAFRYSENSFRRLGNGRKEAARYEEKHLPQPRGNRRSISFLYFHPGSSPPSLLLIVSRCRGSFLIRRRQCSFFRWKLVSLVRDFFHRFISVAKVEWSFPPIASDPLLRCTESPGAKEYPAILWNRSQHPSPGVLRSFITFL